MDGLADRYGPFTSMLEAAGYVVATVIALVLLAWSFQKLRDQVLGLGGFLTTTLLALFAMAGIAAVLQFWEVVPLHLVNWAILATLLGGSAAAIAGGVAGRRLALAGPVGNAAELNLLAKYVTFVLTLVMLMLTAVIVMRFGPNTITTSIKGVPQGATPKVVLRGVEAEKVLITIEGTPTFAFGRAGPEADFEIMARLHGDPGANAFPLTHGSLRPTVAEKVNTPLPQPAFKIPFVVDIPEDQRVHGKALVISIEFSVCSHRDGEPPAPKCGIDNLAVSAIPAP